MGIIGLLGLFCLFMSLWPKKKEAKWKFTDGPQGFMCTACYSTADHYFTRCPNCGMTEEDFLKRTKTSRKSKEPEFPNAKFTCKYCKLKTIDEYYFCPRCGKDDKGLLEEESKALHKGTVISGKEWN